MRVLLTGASGFLGRYVLRALQQSGIAAVALGRTRPQGLGASPFMAADLLATADFTQLTRQAGASHLLHLAWVTGHGQYWTSALNYRWVDATTRLVQAFCETGGQHVVVAGTCAEYDWAAGLCREDMTPLEPATVYGAAKDATRRLVTALCSQHKVRCAWARVFFPFGAGEAPERLVPALVEVLQGRRPAFGVNAQVYRDFLHAGDVARGLLTLLRMDACGSYNISSGQPTQIGELVHLLAQLLERDPRGVLDLPSQRPPQPACLVGENLKLKTLGWRQELTLVQGLETSLRDLSACNRNQETVSHGG